MPYMYTLKAVMLLLLYHNPRRLISLCYVEVNYNNYK